MSDSIQVFSSPLNFLIVFWNHCQNRYVQAAEKTKKDRKQMVTGRVRSLTMSSAVKVMSS